MGKIILVKKTYSINLSIQFVRKYFVIFFKYENYKKLPGDMTEDSTSLDSGGLGCWARYQFAVSADCGSRRRIRAEVTVILL